MTVVNETKTNIRTRILELLRNQKEEDRQKKSLAILDALLVRPEFQNAKTILFYASFDGEVETFAMMERAQQLGKRIALPMIIRDQKGIVPTLVQNLAEDLEKGPYGILQCRQDRTEQIGLEEIDLVIVPGIAFDRHNSRLGRGQGYYDRFLESLPKDTPAIGLAFDFQLFDRLPSHAHDKSVSYVITN